MAWEVYVYLSDKSFKYWSAELSGATYSGKVVYGGIGSRACISSFTSSRLQGKIKKGYILANVKSSNFEPTAEEILDIAKSHNKTIHISRFIKAFGYAPDDTTLKLYKSVLKYDKGVEDALSDIEEFF